MRTVGRFGPIALIAAATMAAPALAGSVTVGHFYTAVAQAKQLESTDAVSAEAKLRGAGFDLPRLALDKELTEGDLTVISKSLGVAVMTNRPSQPISASQLETYFSVFADRLRTRAVGIGVQTSVNADDNHQGDDNNDQGKPHSKSKP